MTPKELESLLVGKTIKRINYYQYLDWPMCVSEIHFTDGSYIEMGGNADEARIDLFCDEKGVAHTPLGRVVE